MDVEQFRAAAHAAIDEVIDYYETIQDRDVLPAVEPGYLKKLIPQDPPEMGEAWSAIQKDISSKIMPGLTHWQSPNFMAFFPSASTYPGILGEIYSAAFTGPAFNWICSPAVTELETIVMDWLAKALHLPSCFLSSGAGGGVIQGTASESVLVAMVAARDRYLKGSTAHAPAEERDALCAQKQTKLVAIGGEWSHTSVRKASMVTGTHNKHVPADEEDGYCMTGKKLLATLQECRREGLEPFFLTVTLGTTSTCAVDQFGEIAVVMREFPDVWVHVDAAYAGAALVCEEYQNLTEHFAAFDSFNINMHKWLLTNFDASGLFFKQRAHVIGALSITPSYMRNKHSESGQVIDYRDWQIPLGRRFRALKVWFVMRTYGLQGLKDYIRKHIGLGELFHSLVVSRPDLFEVLTGPAFALTVFRAKPPAQLQSTSSAASTGNTAGSVASGEGNVAAALDANALTKAVADAIFGEREIFLTSVDLRGKFAIRVVSANEKADEAHVRKAFDIIVRTTEAILRQHGY